MKGILILDSHGKRVLGHYYDPEVLSSLQEQSAFERKLYKKTMKTNVEVLIHQGFPIVYKYKLMKLSCQIDDGFDGFCFSRPNVDLCFYVIGAQGENELMLQSVLQCLFDSLRFLLRKDVEKKSVMQNLGTVMLAVDEICDHGIIMEFDAHNVARRVVIRADDLPIGEQTVSQVFQNYKEQLKMSLMR